MLIGQALCIHRRINRQGSEIIKLILDRKCNVGFSLPLPVAKCPWGQSSLIGSNRLKIESRPIA